MHCNRNIFSIACRTHIRGTVAVAVSVVVPGRLEETSGTGPGRGARAPEGNRSNREGPMPHYMYQGNYTGEAIRRLVSRPEDRSKVAAKLASSVGGKLREYFMSFGEHDFVAIMDLPDDEAAATLSFAVSAAGHITNMRTTKLLTPAEATKAMGRAGGGKALIKPPKGK
jgi:uncharacterized protein with GYD domain